MYGVEKLERGILYRTDAKHAIYTKSQSFHTKDLKLDTLPSKSLRKPPSIRPGDASGGCRSRCGASSRSSGYRAVLSAGHINKHLHLCIRLRINAEDHAWRSH